MMPIVMVRVRVRVQARVQARARAAATTLPLWICLTLMMRSVLSRHWIGKRVLAAVSVGHLIKALHPTERTLMSPMAHTQKHGT